MPASPAPSIRFLASSLLGQVAVADLDLSLEIPLQRPGTGRTPGFPLGVYFESLRAVIEQGGYGLLREAVETRLGRRVGRQDLREIRIYSEKHGGDYHPAKIEVQLPERALSFAMNVALHERGRSVVANEYVVLSNLIDKFGAPLIPTPYFFQEFETVMPSGEKAFLSMYLADWFEEFYEFHLSRDPSDGKQKLVLWDTAHHDHYLAGSAARRIYREMAQILTLYYDVKTFAQIYPWHPAAGDFIARSVGDGVEVRLVAARQYGPLVGPPHLPPEEALLFFFLNLTLRLRVDRLDGVGEMAWAGPDCLEPMVHGFLLALGEKKIRREISGGFPTGFLSFLKNLSPGDLEERLVALSDTGGTGLPEESFVKQRLGIHSEQLMQIIQSGSVQPFPVLGRPLPSAGGN